MNKDIEQNFFKVLKQNNLLDKNSLEDLVNKVGSRVWIFSFLPFIKQVAVCNNLSFKIASKDSDIDLFFILDSKRFFMARIIITTVLSLLCFRRNSNKVYGRFCLSFFISDKRLNLSSLRLNLNDYYFYFWFKYLFFLKNDNQVVIDLIKSNKDWFKDELFLLSNNKSGYLRTYNSNFISVWLEKFLGLQFFDLLEASCRKFQLARAKKKNEKLGFPSGVIIKDGLLKFHVKDLREEINREVGLLI